MKTSRVLLCSVIAITLISIRNSPFVAVGEATETPSQKEKTLETYYYLRDDDDTFDEFQQDWGRNPEQADKAWRMVRTLCSSTLGQLGYGTGPFGWDFGERERSALKQFQEDLDIPKTGHLDSLTIHHLHKARASLDLVRLILPMKSFVSLHEIGVGYITAKNSWKAIDFDLAYPVNTVIVVCNKQSMTCDVFSADFAPKIQGNRQIFPNHDAYDIVSWTDEMVMAKAEYQERTSVLTINIPTETVRLTSHGRNNAQNDVRTMELVDGLSLWRRPKELLTESVYSKVYGEKDKYEALFLKNAPGLSW